MAGSGVRGALQGASFGALDELNAGLYAGYDWLTGKGGFGENYDKRLAHERAIDAETQDAHPYVYTGGQVAGSVATALPALPARGATTAAGMIGRGALAAGAEGALQGFGSGEGVGGRLAGAGIGAGVGAVTGGLGGGVGAVATSGARKAGRHALLDALDSSASRDAAEAGYGALRAAPERVAPDTLRRVADEAQGEAGKLGYVAGAGGGKLDDAFRAVRGAADDAGDGLNMSQMETLRRQAASLPGQDAVHGRALLDALDGAMKTANPEVHAATAGARSAYSSALRKEAFAQAAQDMSQGASTKTVASRLLREQGRFLPDDLRDALRGFAINGGGDRTAFQRLLDQAAKLAPQEAGALGNIMQAGMGVATGGHSLVVPAIGWGARALGGGKKAHGNALVDLLTQHEAARAGRTAAQAPAPSRTQEVADTLARLLARGAGTGTAWELRQAR